MQVQKNSRFYSNLTGGLDEKLDDERQLLVQEQMACRARAHQFSLETNQRRKAQEERKKQREAQEQRLRENILQQRKQRLQEATERFLRGHRPTSQRRRSAFTTKAPDLDEALSCIQGDQITHTYHPSLLSGSSTTSRTCTCSPKPPGGPRSLHAVSAALAYAKLKQERTLGDFKPSQQIFINQLQENIFKDQEQLRKQEQIDTQIDHAESLSSLDSLENDVPQNHDRKLDSLKPPEVHDTRRPTSLQREINGPSPSSNHCPPKSTLEKVISQQGLSSSSSSSSPSEYESADEDQSIHNFTKAAQQCNITDQSQTSNIQPTISCQNQVSATTLKYTECQYGITTEKNISTDNSTVAAYCKMQTDLGSLPMEYLSMAQQSSSNSGVLSKCAKHPSEMQAARKSNICTYSSASYLDKVTPSLESSALQLAEAEKSLQSVKKKPDEDGILVLEKRTQLESFEQYNRAKHPNLAEKYSDSRMTTAILPSSKMTVEADTASVDTLTNCTDLKSSDVQVLKGILKKKFKYKENGAAKFSNVPGNFTFSKQVAISIRDSLELCRSNFRDAGGNKRIKKKLRWCDELNNDGEENRDKVTKELNKHAETQCILTEKPLVNQKQGLFHTCYTNITLGIPKNNMIISGTADPNLTQQAWSDVGVQKGKHQESTRYPRVESAACTSRLLIPQWAYSARTGSGTISSQVRRGTMVRPQSSSQVQHLVRTQGRAQVPRAPTKSYKRLNGGNSTQSIKTITQPNTGNNNECFQDKACLAVEQIFFKDCSAAQPVLQHHILKTGQGTILAPGSPYACVNETVSKGIYTLGQVGSGRSGFQKGILDRTPTDEEISLLWNGVRSALSNKDGDSQSLYPHNEPLSALPQTHANLSHVTINGDSMFNDVKAVPRTGGLCLSSSNAQSPVKRPTLENNVMKHRTAALGYRKAPVLYQAMVPITASKSVHDQGIAQDGNEQAAVVTAHFQRATEFQQSQQDLSALSLEEQRLLQSLDRLNHRLQYVQNPGNPAIKGILGMDPAFNQSPQPVECSYATLCRYHGVAADSRTHPQRRY